MPDSIPAAEQARLQAAAREAITKTVVPSYRKLKQYMVDEYLPRTRESVGLWDTPNGTDRYAELARFYTTTNLTPDEIHAIGLDEVARIRGEMQKPRCAAPASRAIFAEFLTYLRTDPKFSLHRRRKAAAARHRAIGKRIDPMLPRVFRQAAAHALRRARRARRQLAPDYTAGATTRRPASTASARR